MKVEPPDSETIQPPESAADTHGPSPVKQVMGIRPYKIPTPQASVDLCLDGNEGIAPPVRLLESLSARAPEVLRRYPQPWLFEARLAERLGVEKEQVLVTAGGDESLDRICRAYLAPGRELILPSPTFEMFSHYAGLAGAQVIPVPWIKGGYPTEAVLAQVRPETAAVALVSPNNPTGAVARPEDLIQVAEAAPQALIIVDLAYGEFADEDLMSTALELPNAVAVRSFSKAWGLAGLRMGYAVGPVKLIGWMRAAGGPYTVSRPSLALAQTWLEAGGPRMADFVSRIKEERSELFQALKRLGGEPFPSQANFVLCRFPKAEWVHRALAGQGIAVRIFHGPPELDGCLRITCPGEAPVMARLLSALETVRNPQGLLLDMDGVLADVSTSYRQAILETALSFGVELDPAEIREAKNESGSNNDWEVTRRLVARHGVEVSLPEVTERFESFYQGEADRPGLWESERLLPDIELLRRLARRMPLAVVTGRPRADAGRFLEQMGIDTLVSALVCMEDTPPKPDPAPLMLALQRLGIERAWMVGDMPDDIVAAKAAGVIPLGTVPPGDDAQASQEALIEAGAAWIIDDLGGIEELLLYPDSIEEL